jgi:hypothetical protein
MSLKTQPVRGTLLERLKALPLNVTPEQAVAHLVGVKLRCNKVHLPSYAHDDRLYVVKCIAMRDCSSAYKGEVKYWITSRGSVTSDLREAYKSKLQNFHRAVDAVEMNYERYFVLYESEILTPR